MAGRTAYGDGSYWEEGAKSGTGTGRWLADVPRPDGRRKRLTAHSESDIKARMREFRRQIAQGTWVASQRLTVNTHLDNYLEDKARHVQPHSLRCYRNRLAHVRPHIGKIPLQSLKPHDVKQAFGEIEGEGLSSTTVHDIHVQLAMAMKSAVDDRLIAWNPMARMRAPKPADSTRDALTLEDTRRLIQGARDDELGALFHLILKSGLRIGEAAALRRQDIDFGNPGTVRVRQAVKVMPGKKVEGGGLIIGEPKTRKSVRDVPIDQDACSALQQHYVRQLEKRLAAPAWDHPELVFTERLGCILTEHEAIHALYAACDRLGIRRVTLHELRHTYGTQQIELGTDLATVSKLMGHSSIKTTVDVYGHISSRSERAASTRLQEAIRGAKAPV